MKGVYNIFFKDFVDLTERDSIEGLSNVEAEL